MAYSVMGLIEVNGSRLFMPGGDVNNWCHEVGTELRLAAIRFCPPNRSMSRRGHVATGKLAATIAADVSIEAPEVLSISLGAGPVFREERGGRKRNYTPFVLGGTAYQGYRYIYSTVGWENKAEIDLIMRRIAFNRRRFGKGERDGWYMKLPGGQFALRVHGQRKNPFLSDAYHLVSRTHSALPRVTGMPGETL